ncbi:MAG: hypothetical protein PHQ39_13770, partial [Methanothrix soehngenii]|nr:hypothetical protein [Methanothrix soehngenii]
PEGDYNGNVSMLIWLGKQYQRQSDHLKLSGDEEEPLVVNTLADFVKNAAAKKEKSGSSGT